MGPKKWTKQEAFILFRQRNNTFVKNGTGQRNVAFGYLISEDSKPSLGLG